MRLLAAVLAALALTAVPAAAQDYAPESAPDAGRPFTPEPLSQPLFGTAPATHKQVVTGLDGTDLFVETWLPAEKDGEVPPKRFPTVLIATPYVKTGTQRYTTRNLANVVEWFTSRGYAVAQHHVRGTGGSGGCLEQTASLQIDDTARVIEWLGRDAPWAEGNVAMYGHSYDAETQLSVAGRGDPDRITYLKAIVPSASVAGQYEYSHMDGVPFAGQALLSNGGYLVSSYTGSEGDPMHHARRAECAGDLGLASVDPRGDLTPFWAEREYRPGRDRIRAASLFVHGLADYNVQSITESGFFDHLPASTPVSGLFGIWEHNYPDKHAVQSSWARQDFLPMVTAWYDRWLKGLPTGAERWPRAQVQGTDGQWRHEAGWPETGGPAGQLALGPAGALGATAPTGATAFTEGSNDTGTVPGTRAVFETTPVTEELHLTGMPVLDLWLTTDRPDGHATAKLEVVGTDGRVPSLGGAVGTYGARSLQHLDAMPGGYFEQRQGRLVTTPGTPVRVPVRFQPHSFHVPAGGKLRLTVAGATTLRKQTVPSGAAGSIRLLHDCKHPSALRFLMPREDGPLLDVQEVEEQDAPQGGEAPVRSTDGGGLATAPVCGQAPLRPAAFGPVVERPGPALHRGGGRR